MLGGYASATPLNTGNGKQFLIECDGTAIPLSACFKKANAVCPAGWDMISRDGSVVPQAVVTREFCFLGAVEHKNITVQAPAGAMKRETNHGTRCWVVRAGHVALSPQPTPSVFVHPRMLS